MEQIRFGHKIKELLECRIAYTSINSRAHNMNQCLGEENENEKWVMLTYITYAHYFVFPPQKKRRRQTKNWEFVEQKDNNFNRPGTFLGNFSHILFREKQTLSSIEM